MKKSYLIAIISGIFLLIVLTWGYLFIYGTPDEAKGLFATFGIIGGDPVGGNTENTRLDTGAFDEDGSLQRLRQITTRPVVGMVFVDENTIRYVERGTGHIYEIDIPSGTETQITNTTFLKIIDAELSPDGNRVVYTTETNTTTRTNVGTIVKNDTGQFELESTSLAGGAHDADFRTNTEVTYLLPTVRGTEGHIYDMIERTDRILFSVPFRQARASWDADTYVYTKPAGSLLGYVYEIRGGAPQFLRSGGFGLTAFGNAGTLVTSEIQGNNIVSYAYRGEDEVQIPIVIFPEKCAATTDLNELICAAPLGLTEEFVFPDSWYQGIISLEDYLWRVDVRQQEAELLGDPTQMLGRSVDVLKMVSNTNASAFLFTNKHDNTLWLFEPTPRTTTAAESDT